MTRRFWAHTVILFSTALLSCGSDPVSTQEELFGTAAFLSLEVGETKMYDFEFNNHNHTSTGGTVHKKIGIIELEVTRSISAENFTAVSLVRTYNGIIHSTYSYEQGIGIFDSTGLDPYTVSDNLYIMFVGDSIYYVENAPSLERLDEGVKSLLMAAPLDTGNVLNLKLYFPEGYGISNSEYEGSSNGDSLLYDTHSINYNLETEIETQVIFIRDRGLSSVSYANSYNPAAMAGGYTTLQLNIIE